MRVLLGVSGGIAAYKACELSSRLVKQGHELRVIMSESATHFVGPATFEALSGHGVMTDTFGHTSGTEGPGAVQHINLAKWAEVAILAPATAGTLGKLAHGVADNALITVWMAIPASTPVLIAPAMNTEMWNHPANLRNVDWLAACGRYRIIDPVVKRLACGDTGIGGLAEVDDLVSAVERAGR